MYFILKQESRELFFSNSQQPSVTVNRLISYFSSGQMFIITQICGV